MTNTVRHHPRFDSGSSHRARRAVTRGFLYLSAYAVLGAVIIPVAYAALSGFRDTAQLASDPVGLPDPWIFTNYLD